MSQVNNKFIKALGVALAATKALVSDSSGNITTAASTTATEIGYVNGVTSAIQTQLNGKATTSLNNISATAFNSDIIPATSAQNLGSTSIPVGHVYSQNFMNPLASSNVTFNTASIGSGAAASGAITQGTGNVDTGTSGNIAIASGTVGGVSGTTGNITIQSGNASGATSGTSGNVTIKVGNATTTVGSLTLAGNGVINMSSNRLTNVTTPTGTNDAANKTYVDGKFTVNARYYASTTIISGSLATIVWTTQDYDVNNAMSSGVYTIPTGQAGKYQINSALLITGTIALNNNLILEIQKNGTVVSRYTDFFPATLTDGKGLISDIINCAAGDTIRIQVSTSVTGPSIVSSNFDNYFSIAKIGT